VLLGNGDGTFQTAVNYATGSGPPSVAIGDLNGDGYPDLVLANYGISPDFQGSVSVLLGNGDGTFQPAVNYEAGTSSDSVAIGDLDGDGHPDLVVANWGSKNVSVLINLLPSVLVSIAVTPVNPSIPMETTQRFTAMGTFSDSTTQNLTAAATWSSSALGFATISNAPGSNGKATAVGVGSTTIRATVGSISGSTVLTVTQAKPPCFIATASFGTEMAHKISVLQEFRDTYLLRSDLGRAFVQTYYTYSPPIADYIAQRPWLRAVVRTLLLPVVGFVSLFV
jgi:FG-GAP-like repeat/Bacterial Ig-like domain (group 2)